jgi:hypothetical protein
VTYNLKDNIVIYDRMVDLKKNQFCKGGKPYMCCCLMTISYQITMWNNFSLNVELCIIVDMKNFLISSIFDEYIYNF